MPREKSPLQSASYGCPTPAIPYSTVAKGTGQGRVCLLDIYRKETSPYSPVPIPYSLPFSGTPGPPVAYTVSGDFLTTIKL
jgi:hypothetical protein